MLERLIERSEVKVDVAACIRWTFWGATTLLLAVSIVIERASEENDGRPSQADTSAISQIPATGEIASDIP